MLNSFKIKSNEPIWKMMGGVDGCLSSSDRAVGVHQTKVGNHWTTGLCVCVCVCALRTYLYRNALVHVSVCCYMWCKTKLHRAKPHLKRTRLLSQSILKRPWTSHTPIPALRGSVLLWFELHQKDFRRHFCCISSSQGAQPYTLQFTFQ